MVAYYGKTNNNEVSKDTTKDTYSWLGLHTPDKHFFPLYANVLSPIFWRTWSVLDVHPCARDVHSAYARKLDWVRWRTREKSFCRTLKWCIFIQAGAVSTKYKKQASLKEPSHSRH